jgi:Flp pilus assembly pilin Flp
MLRLWLSTLRLPLRREQGQTMAEYGVVLALITLAVAGSIALLASAFSDKLGFITSTLGGALFA